MGERTAGGGTLRVKLGGHRNSGAEPLHEGSHREDIPRTVRLLALAHRWHRLIDEGEITSQAEIARRTGLTRARVTQILNLRYMSPLLQTLLEEFGRDAATDPPSRFAFHPRWDRQRLR